MPKLSIIVPVYKVEKYLNKCVDSILGQTYTDFEVILIDDGSPDNCGAICDEYAKKDSRVVVIHQENAGVSAARNAGLKAARGEFIGFVDSDDWIEPEMYEVMINKLQESATDVVCCGLNHFDETGEYLFTELTSELILSKDELLETLFRMPNPLGGAIFNKVYRRDVINKLYFRTNLSMAEDRMFLLEVYQNCVNGIKLADSFNNVLDRADSSSRDERIEIPCKMLDGSEMMIGEAQKYSRQLECFAADKFLDDCIRHIKRIADIGIRNNYEYKPYIKKYCNKMRNVIIKMCFAGVFPKRKLHGYVYEYDKLKKL